MSGGEQRAGADGALSRHERFQAWLAMNDHLVDDEFLVFDVEGMPDDPYTVAGLRVAEADLLRRFATVDDALAAENRDLFDKFIRYLGTAFVTGLGFRWTDKPAGKDDGTAYIGVEHPAIKTQLAVASLATAAVHRRTGEEWSFVYQNMNKRLSKVPDRSVPDRA